MNSYLVFFCFKYCTRDKNVTHMWSDEMSIIRLLAVSCVEGFTRDRNVTHMWSDEKEYEPTGSSFLCPRVYT